MANKTKAETKMRNTKNDKKVHICPACHSEKTNKVTLTTWFCMDCDVEFDSTDKVYTIQWDGTLVDHYVNEFINCG